jgi:hypothetical protein
MFYPWSATGDRDESWYQSKKESMLSWQLHQEYPSTPEEAFIKSGNPVFDLEALEEMGRRCTAGREGWLSNTVGGRNPEWRAAA